MLIRLGVKLIEIILMVLAGFFVAWNIGANDTANCAGTAVGGRIIAYRRAIAVVVIFVVLGAVLEGWKNMNTVGTSIITAPPGQQNPLTFLPLVTVGIMLAAGIWVLIATIFGLPVSTSQSMIGAVMGVGVLMVVLRPDFGVNIQYGKLGTIALSWVLNPLIAAIAAYLIFKMVTPALRRIKNLLILNRVLSILIIISAAYSAYSLGANDVGTSTGVIYGYFGGSQQLIALFGAVALAIGTITFSRRVMLTVGSGITELDPTTAFSAQFGAAITVWSFVQFGMPVSTSQAIVGGVIGAGLTKGAKTVSKSKMSRIVLAWVLTPIVGFILSFTIGFFMLRV